MCRNIRMDRIDSPPVFWVFCECGLGGCEVGLTGSKAESKSAGRPGNTEGVERVEGIEPSTKAWEAFVLPLNYTRSKRLTLYQKSALMRSFLFLKRAFQGVG